MGSPARRCARFNHIRWDHRAAPKVADSSLPALDRGHVAPDTHKRPIASHADG